MAIKPLIDAKAALDVQDHEDETALTAACSEGHRRAAETLIAVGASVNRCCAGNTTPLMIAIRENYIGLAEALIKFKANVDDVCAPCSLSPNPCPSILPPSVLHQLKIASYPLRCARPATPA